ncbi:MAG: glycosyl transferase family 28 [Gammaproteobacteria bacterium]|nr:glycosyl transferase family 28 [Gammaproteobacteria bacterium]
MIYVQHLLGSGHLQRCLQLAGALAVREFEVLVVSGGLPQSIPLAAGVRLHQLPPLYSPDGSFNRLLDASGREIDDNLRALRRRQLLEQYQSMSPGALITETFPFGRRMMSFEIIPLLETARRDRNCVQVISSVRDILQPKSQPRRNREIRDLVGKYYDHVLVHGDPTIAGLEYSFADARDIADKVCYSGYIAKTDYAAPPGTDGHDEVLVSAGGSSTGLELLKTAIAARPLTSLVQNRWRILVSAAIGQAEFRELQQFAGRGIVVERNRTDFTGLMHRARLSISQAGYNTLTDVLGSGVAAVVIPFADADEIEQTLRARRLQQRGRLIMLEQQHLSAATLAASIERALGLDTSLEIDLDGAPNSAAMIERWIEAAAA